MTDARATESSARRRPGRPRHEQPSPDYLRRRREIVDAAASLFEAKGYDAASLDDVAAALDLRKASLYYYVQSKAELLYLVFDRAISRALEDIQAIATNGSAAERLQKLIRHQVTTVTSDPSLFAVFFDQRPRLESDYEGEIREKERRYLRKYVEVVQAAISDHTIAMENPRYAAQLLLGMATWTYKWFDPARDDADAIADAAIHLILGRSLQA